MTDTPDLRTLAAEALWADGMGPVMGPEALADAVLAAVLPAHRRQVLAEAAEVPVEHPASADVIQRATIEVGAEQLRKAIRRLASAAPETAPRPRQDDETAPAVPEDTPDPTTGDWHFEADPIDERAARAAGWVPLAEVLDALRDHDAFVEWTRSNGPSGYLADYVGRDDRDSCARYLAERFPTAPQDYAATDPETGPTSALPAEPAPAVGREAPEAPRPTEGAVPDGPRTWALPDEPGPEVTAVRDEGGQIWDRNGIGGWDARGLGGNVVWEWLIKRAAPLTDATPADGQDGDGRG